MCLIHDMGEAITGDIPAFEKTDKDRKVENKNGGAADGYTSGTGPCRMEGII